MLLPKAPKWHEEAACANTDPEAFFPETGSAATEAVKTICRGCDVQTECLTGALERNERHGIWGGLSWNERKKLKKP